MNAASKESQAAKPTPQENPQFRIVRSQQQRPDGLSSTLQIGKASEHLACAELILQGWNAFIADAGLPYDILVDAHDGKFFRVQVKATTRMYERDGFYPAYRFAMRRSRTGNRRITLDGADFVAFVALDRRLVAWMPVKDLLTASGQAKLLIEMKTRQIQYVRRYSGVGGSDPAKSGKFIEDYSLFDPWQEFCAGPRGEIVGLGCGESDHV